MLIGIDFDIPIGIIAGMTPNAAIEALRASGMTEVAIGNAVGARQSTINRIRRGDMVPNWDLGQRIVALASKKRRKAA